MASNLTPKGLEEVGDGIFVLKGDLRKLRRWTDVLMTAADNH